MEQQTQHPDERPEAAHHVKLEVRLLPDGAPVALRIERSATLLELLPGAAEALDVQLLPNTDEPLDTLHNLGPREHDDLVTDLDVSVEDYLRAPHTTHDFGVRLERVLLVNTQARVAPTASLSPREILSLFGMDASYALFLPNIDEPLPLDGEIPIERGTRLEAQRDGRYGVGAPVRGSPPSCSASSPSCASSTTPCVSSSTPGSATCASTAFQPPPRSREAPARHPHRPSARVRAGRGARRVLLGATQSLPGPPAPACRQRRHAPHAGGRHLGAVSWHYRTPGAWRFPQDNLVTHVQHCKSFFRYTKESA